MTHYRLKENRATKTTSTTDSRGELDLTKIIENQSKYIRYLRNDLARVKRMERNHKKVNGKLQKQLNESEQIAKMMYEHP